MQPIQPTSSFSSGGGAMPVGGQAGLPPQAPIAGGQTAGGMSSLTSVNKIAANAGLVTTLGGATSSTATQLTEQVQGFLSQVSPDLGNNDYLKLLIAAMIMQHLLNGGQGGGQGGGQSSQAGGDPMMNLLEGLSGSRNSALYMSMESSTNIVQIEHSSTRLDTASAVQTITESADAPTDENPLLGRELDQMG